MGKHKRMLQRCGPASLRHHDLNSECDRYGVRTIYDLPVSVHYEHRAMRLMGAFS